MIALIPYQTFEIKTRLSQEVALQKLQEIVEPRRFLRWGLSRNHNLFEGEIQSRFFTISRIIHYRNSFLPVLIGQIQDDLDSSTLKITARPMWVIIIFWALFFFAVGAGGFVTGDILAEPWVVIPFLFFFYMVPTASFNFELYKAKKLLEKQFDTDEFLDSF